MKNDTKITTEEHYKLNLDWNPKQDILVYFQNIKNEEEKDKLNNKKIKIDKNQLIKKINDLLKENLFDSILELLNDYPTLTLTGPQSSVLIHTLKDHFNIKIAEKFIEHQLEIPFKHMINMVYTRSDVEIIDLLMSYKNKNNSSFVQNEISNVYVNTLQTLTSKGYQKKDLLAKKMYFEYKYADFVNSVQKEELYFEQIFFLFHLKNTDEYFQKLETCLQTPEKFKSSVKKSLEYFFNPYLDLTVEYMHNLFCLLEKNQNLYILFEEEQHKLKQENQNYMNFVSTYIQKDIPFKQSLLVDYIKKYQKKPFLFPIEEFLNESESKNLLHLNTQELFLISIKNIFYLNIDEKNKQNVPVEKIPDYQYDSIFKAIIDKKSNTSIFKMMLASVSGKKYIYETLTNDIYILNNFIKNTNLDNIHTVLKEIPELITWRDIHKNSIFHYITDIRKETTKTFVKMIARLDHNVFLEENEVGTTIKILLEKNGISEETKSFMEKQILHRNLKEVESIQFQNFKEKKSTKRRI